MLKRAALLLACSGITFLSLSQVKKPTQKKEKPILVFSVAEEQVRADEFIYLYKKNHQNVGQDFTKAKIEEYLTLFINFKLKVHEAKHRGMDTTAAFIKEFNTYKDELRKPYLPDAKLTDSLVRLTYERMKEEVKASHILINLKPDALPEDTLKAHTKIIDIRNRILQGEDFSKAAALYSEDPSAKSNQGNLGYFTAMQMVYPFETAAYNTKVGAISQPLRTRFGYHIVKVFDRRPARGEVEVSHIMIRTGDQNEKAKNTIFNVYEQLQAGVKWDELCKQYSEDPATKDTGGRLRPFGTGAMGGVPEFEKMAFDLQKPGDVSDPFQTQYGWHIIRLEKKIPLGSLESMAPTLKNRVTRDERTELSKQALQAKLRHDYMFSENTIVKAKAFALADSTLQQGVWKSPPYPDAEKDGIFQVQNRKYTVKEFFTYLQQNQRTGTQSTPKYLEQAYNNYVDGIIIQLVEAKIAQENPSYRYLLNEYYEGILLFEIMEKEVWNKASEDSVGQVAYYNTHVSEYQAGERGKTIIYSFSSPEITAPLQELVLAGADGKIQEFVTLKKIKTESGYFKKSDKPIFQKMPWAKGVYPVENNGMYYLAWLKEILPPGPMTFEEARPAIISDYQAFLEKTWLEQLKKGYRVKVNEKGKQYVLQQLQTK